MPRIKSSDPSNSFHELRRFLFSLGIGTRISTFMSCPLPQYYPRASRHMESANATNWSCVDNFFMFELRNIFPTDAGPVNSVAFLFRVFFDDSQDSDTLHVQIVCNHKGHGTLEMTQAYDEVVAKLLEEQWVLVPYSSNVLALEKRFTSLHEFKQQFMPLHSIFKRLNVINSRLPSEMQC